MRGVAAVSNEILSDEQRAWVDGLRAMADFLETRPGLVGQTGYTLNHFPVLDEDDEDNGAVVDWWVNELGEELVQGQYLIARARFGPHKVDVNFRRWEVPPRSPDPGTPSGGVTSIRAAS
jgi:hypothetical protein